MPTLTEKLEELTVLDKLKEREEDPLSNGGKWEPFGASSSGKVTATGWVSQASEEAAGAKWTADSWDTRLLTALGIEVEVLPETDEFLTLGWTGSSSATAAIGKTPVGWLVYLFIGSEFVGEAKCDAALGDRFFITSDQFEVVIYRLPVAGELELLVSAEGFGIGEEADTASIGFFPEGHPDTSVRITNFAAEFIGEPPVNTALPEVSGIPASGNALTVSTGEWDGEVFQYRYMWQISTGIGWLNLFDFWRLASDGASYVVPDFAEGRSLRCAVRAEGTGGTTDAVSDSVLVAGAKVPARLFIGDKIEKYSYKEEAAENRITEVLDPLGSGETVLKFTVEDGDVYPLTSTENPRAKLEGPPWLIEGSEVWLRFAFLIPEDFPEVPGGIGGFVNLLDYWGAPFEDSAPWKINIGDHGDLRWQRNVGYDFDVPWSVPVLRDEWVGVVLHLLFSDEGYVEMWVNGEKATFFDPDATLVYNPNEEPTTEKLFMATRDFSVDIGPVGNSIQQYRKVGMFEEETIYQKPLELWLDLGVPGPLAVTGAATGNIVLNGTVYPGGEPTRYYFEYGETEAYGSTTEVGEVAAGVDGVSVMAEITGLKPLVTYHFRLVVENMEGKSWGADETFTTVKVSESSNPSLNWFLDPGFESGALSYSFRELEIGVIDATRVVSDQGLIIAGNGSLRVNAEANSEKGVIISVGWRTPTLAAQVWSAGAWAGFSTVGMKARLSLGFQNAGGGNLGLDGVLLDPEAFLGPGTLGEVASASYMDGALERAAPELLKAEAQIAPVGAAFVVVRLSLVAEEGIAGATTFDNALLIESSQTPDHPIDGDRGGMDWVGSRFFSPSYVLGDAPTLRDYESWTPAYLWSPQVLSREL